MGGGIAVLFRETKIDDVHLNRSHTLDIRVDKFGILRTEEVILVSIKARK